MYEGREQWLEGFCMGHEIFGHIMMGYEIFFEIFDWSSSFNNFI